MSGIGGIKSGYDKYTCARVRTLLIFVTTVLFFCYDSTIFRYDSINYRYDGTNENDDCYYFLPLPLRKIGALLLRKGCFYVFLRFENDKKC